MMDFLATPAGVFVILGVVAAAVLFAAPSGYSRTFKRLAERYETKRKPERTPFKDQRVLVGSDFIQFDIGLDDEGLWLVYDGPSPKKAPDRMLIPWNCLLDVGIKKSAHNFRIYANKPVTLAVPQDLGSRMARLAVAMEDKTSDLS